MAAKMAPDELTTIQDLQGMLAADASACAAAWGALGAVPGIRHSAQQDESEYLHYLRVDVHDGDAGAKGHHRRHRAVCRFEGLHRPVAVAATGRYLGTARRVLRRMRQCDLGA